MYISLNLSLGKWRKLFRVTLNKMLGKIRKNFPTTHARQSVQLERLNIKHVSKTKLLKQVLLFKIVKELLKQLYI